MFNYRMLWFTILTGVPYGDFYSWEKPYLHMWEITIIFCFCLRTQTELMTGYSVYSGLLMNANMFSFWNMNLCKATCSCEWGVNVINNIIHGWLGIWNFFSHVQCDISLVICPRLWDNELTTQREIPYPRVPVYSSQYNTYRIIHGLVEKWNFF